MLAIGGRKGNESRLSDLEIKYHLKESLLALHDGNFSPKETNASLEGKTLTHHQTVTFTIISNVLTHETSVPSRLIGEEASFQPNVRPWTGNLLEMGQVAFCTGTKPGLSSIDRICVTVPTESGMHR